MIAPHITDIAPVTASFVREALSRAIDGIGPLPPAAVAADRQLAEQNGDVEKAIGEVIENHVAYSGAQGFITNLGGLVTLTVAVPANISGLALLQCRMIAGIAHLRGYDLTDPTVRNGILLCLLGEDEINALIREKKIPAPPMALATAPAHSVELDKVIASAVATALIGRVAGKRLASSVGRRIPLMGGLVGMTADAFATWQVGRYAGRELLPRARR
ncbi:MAG: EcsC family protein [Nocardioides sp.]